VDPTQPNPWTTLVQHQHRRIAAAAAAAAVVAF